MKKTLTLILILALLLAVSAPAYAAGAESFTDLSPDSWCYGYVSMVVNMGLFNGTGANTFSPDSTMTRAMFVTVLGRYGEIDPSKYVIDENGGIVTADGVNMRDAPTTVDSKVLSTLGSGYKVTIIESVPDVNDAQYVWFHVTFNGKEGYIRNDLMTESKAVFTDVDPNAWYAPYVMWAYSSGVASAAGSGSFAPDRNITREEICSMLYNFSDVKKYLLKSNVSAKSFSDASTITSDYRKAVGSMQTLGVINGYDDGSFKPTHSASRGEVAAMLVRYIDATGYEPTQEASYDGSGNYIFGTATPDTGRKTVDYFSDACFIGHSLVVGFNTFTDTGSAAFYAKESANIRSLMSYEGWELSTTHTDESGKEVADKGNLAAALAEKSYGKVYIMFGANECGATESSRNNFVTNMGTLVDTVRQSQPDAKIYIMSMTPVYDTYSEKSYSLCRDNLIIYNDLMKSVCRNKHCYYVNLFDLLCDADGYLPDGLSTDGLHLKNESYDAIFDYLLCHTM